MAYSLPNLSRTEIVRLIFYNSEVIHPDLVVWITALKSGLIEGGLPVYRIASFEAALNTILNDARYAGDNELLIDAERWKAILAADRENAATEKRPPTLIILPARRKRKT